MLMPCHQIRIQSALFRDAHNGGITSRTASRDSRRSSSFLTNSAQRARGSASASASIDSGTTSASTSTFSKSSGRGANTNSTTRRAESEGKEERFERVEMENAGAYRLIDRRTGDHVIVWGGAHDPVAPIPSHLLLSPPHPQPQPQPQPGTATAPAPGEIEASRSSGQSRGFAKLKVQKVKSLMMRKSSSSRSQSQVKTRSTMPMPIPGNKTLISHDNDDDDDDDQNEYERPSSDGSDDDISDHNSSSSGDSALFSRGRGRGGGGATRAGASSQRLRGWSGVSSADHYSYSSDREDVPRKSVAIDRAFFSKTSFKNLGCTDDMITALSSLMFLRPSHIQAMAFRAVLEGKSCIIADQSGSGKTLAYLCPLIQRLRREEEALALAKSEPSPGCPRVIVLAPTAELASQVLNNCRLISKSGVPFRSMVATGGFKQKTQLESLQQGLDVLIATPGRLLYLYQHGFLHLSHLQCVVLDEVDILYGEEGFEQVLQSLISAAPVSVQYLFVTATLPLEIYNKVVEVFPDCEVLMGPGMHRTSSGLEEVLVDCSGGENEEKNPETALSNKKNALLRLVQDSPVRKTIVFCNKIETCRKIENVLKRVDRKEARVRVLSFHAALTQDVRVANLKEFLKSQSADSMFLVCTDRASRGIDFKEVDQVVLFDFPREPSEYVRRVGRTARGAGGVGKAYVFAVGKQVPLAGRIIKRNQKGHPLHHVPTAYELQ